MTPAPRRKPLAARLLLPGPDRSAAIDAAAAALRMDVGVCGDRARIAAAHCLDAAVRSATTKPTTTEAAP